LEVPPVPGPYEEEETGPTSREVVPFDPLQRYLAEIKRYPILSREEEHELAVRYKEKGDIEAAYRLVTSNLRLVVMIAREYQRAFQNLLDLIQEGNMGLLEAVKNYDPYRGIRFPSYAVWWIRQAILKAICEKSRMIRLPLNRANELVQIEKARKLVQNSSKSEDAEMKEIAQLLNMDESHVAELVNISRDLVSLETPVYAEKDSSSLGDFVEDVGFKHPEEIVIQESLKEDINKILKTLSEKEAEIIQYRFGLNGRTPLSLKEIGEKYNLTKERIRQIEKKALKRMQHPSRSEILKAYLQ
jgi:RNA polymerase primary sigma factor